MSGVVIIGAGPAGLTAGLELMRAGYQDVTILEASDAIGGLSQTVTYRGNRIDIGGHRFFSKSDWVMNWWRELMPVALPPGADAESSFRLAYQGAHRLLGQGRITAAEGDDGVMLVRNRLSRILFGGQFFDYPLRPSLDVALKLGPYKCLTFGASYMASRLAPIRSEHSLEDFFINRFGHQLYRQFFKEYTEKVWGVPCHEISAEWGAQRIKSLSVGKALAHAVRRRFLKDAAAEQTSLIENFIYPKLGPGQMWEMAAKAFERMGGRLVRQAPVVRIERDGSVVNRVVSRRPDGSEQGFDARHVVSTMPVKELTQALSPMLPEALSGIGGSLLYRDFITVGLLYRKLRPTPASIDKRTNIVPDNWIYIQEPGVKVGRLQIFNNWSPYMVADPDTVWVGLEFFAKENDDLWSMSEDALKALAVKEMRQIGMADPDDAVDAVVIRMPKAYPGYFGAAYQQFDQLRNALDGLVNLYLVGRNGMHRYNNQDHSMLSAKCAVELILAGNPDKTRIWGINVDDDYHEEVISEHEGDVVLGVT